MAMLNNQMVYIFIYLLNDIHLNTSFLFKNRAWLRILIWFNPQDHLAHPYISPSSGTLAEFKILSNVGGNTKDHPFFWFHISTSYDSMRPCYTYPRFWDVKRGTDGLYMIIWWGCYIINIHSPQCIIVKVVATWLWLELRYWWVHAQSWWLNPKKESISQWFWATFHLSDIISTHSV